MTASLRSDDGSIDAVYLDAIAPAASEASIPVPETIDFNQWRFCREGLLQQDIQGAGEWNIAQPGIELAAVALAGKEVPGLAKSG
jgi:hypothetical protein